jgi:hypothetical protein
MRIPLLGNSFPEPDRGDRWTVALRSVIGLGIVVAVALAGSAESAQPAVTPGESRAVVVAELFTSEGCSSCPSADALLRRLVNDQPVAGVDVIGLSMHVDYWDRLGWRDPYSSAFFSRRQWTYNDSIFHNESVYTPQLVIDGHLESVGSDVRAVQRNILAAARDRKARIDLAATVSASTVGVDVTATADGQSVADAELALAVVEDGLANTVTRGENHGRTLQQDAVVRSLATVARLKSPNRKVSGHLDLRLEHDWQMARLRVVALLQERRSRRIVGAASTAIAASR